MIEIVHAPPLATVQDLGFSRGTAWGLPHSGAMDPAFLALANRLVGNPVDAAAVEWSLGAGTIRVTRALRLAIVGLVDVQVNRKPLEPRRLAFTAPARSTITFAPGTAHRFCYLAVAGGIAIPQLLGSRSTYLVGELGGHQGRRLKAGDRLPVGKAADTPAELELRFAEHPDPPGEAIIVRVTRGPQWERFTPAAHATFFGSRYTVSPTSDRMGYRLHGPPVLPRESATLPSEAVCPGAIQIPDGGEPIVVMPDGPTVGGYPKLAVVIQNDLRRVAQCGPTQGIRFREVSLEEARACYSPLP